MPQWRFVQNCPATRHKQTTNKTHSSEWTRKLFANIFGEMCVKITNSPNKKEHFVVKTKQTVGFLREPHFKQHAKWACLLIDMSSFPVEHLPIAGSEIDGALSSNNSQNLKNGDLGFLQAQTLWGSLLVLKGKYKLPLVIRVWIPRKLTCETVKLLMCLSNDGQSGRSRR